jgi:hypothetical protein
VKWVEGSRARGEALGITGELEARVDADAPDIGEVIHVQARQVTCLFGGAQRAEGGLQSVILCLREARTLRQPGATHDAEREAGIPPLQETDGRLDSVGIKLGVSEEVRDRRRHLAGLLRRFGAATKLGRHAFDEWPGIQPEEKRDRGIRLGDFDAGRVLAQETRQVRRRGVRRIELDHRRSDEKNAHRGVFCMKRTARGGKAASGRAAFQ